MIKNEIVELLDSKASDFFPKEGKWKSTCFNKSNVLDEINMPCHLRDNEWLASMIMKKYDLYSLGKGTILEYVTNSEYFNQLRHDYEQRIVSWQIDWMYNDGENWLIDSKLGGDFFMFSPYCDYAFRKGIVDTLLAINMNIDAIEEGIEKNVDKWRLGYIRLAFYNMYNPTHYNFLSKEKLSKPSEEHLEKWIQMRLYEYYVNHKSSVDAYGTITPEMQMTEKEVEELKSYLEEKDKERLAEIQEYNHRKQELSKSAFELKQMTQEDFYSLSYQDCLPEKQNEKKTSEKGLRKILKIFHTNAK